MSKRRRRPLGDPEQIAELEALLVELGNPAAEILAELPDVSAQLLAQLEENAAHTQERR